MFDLSTFVLRGIRRRRMRNVMLALAIVVGVTLTVGVDLSFVSVYSQMDRILVESAGSIDIVVRCSKRPFKVTKLDPLREIPGVAAVSPRVVQTMPVSLEGYEGDAYIVGVTPDDFDFQDTIYTRIEGSRDLTGKKVCVVDERIGDPEIGSFTHIYTYNNTKHGVKRTDFTYSIVGILEPHKISISTRDLYSVYVDMAAARFLFNKAERDLPYIYKDYHVDYAIVKVSDIEEGPRIADEIQRILGTGFTAVALKESLLNHYRNAISGLRDGLGLTQKLSLILVAVVTFNTGLMNVEERTREIGIIRTLGASTFQVFWIFFLETFTVGLIASLAGVAIGTVFGYFLLRYVLGSLLEATLTFSVDAVLLLWGLQVGVVASSLGGMVPAVRAGRGEIASCLATEWSSGRKDDSGILLLGLILFGIGNYPLLPDSIRRFAPIPEGGMVFVMLAALMVMGLSCIVGYLIRRGRRTLGIFLSFLFYKIGTITGRNMGRNFTRTVMCLLLLSTSMSFLITMSGIEVNLVRGIESSLGGFLGADLIVVSDGNFEKELAEEILNLRGRVDVETATPVYVDRQVLGNPGDYKKYNSEGSLMLIESSFFDAVALEFSSETPSDVVLLLLNEPRVCVVTRSLAGVLNVQIGDDIAIEVTETSYDDQGAEYSQSVLERLRVIGLVETAPLQYFTIGGAPLDKVCITPYSNWGYLHPQFRLEDHLVKEDNSEEQTLATVILIETKPGTDLEETRDVILEEFEDSYDIEKILTRENLAEQYAGNIDVIFNVFRASFLFSLGITVIGISQVLFINLRVRRREFGLLKAIGMSETQITLMVVSEVAFLAVVAFLIGYVGGYFSWRHVANVMGMEGFPIPPLLGQERVLNLFTVSLATSLLSTVYPTLVLRRLTPNELLHERGG